MLSLSAMATITASQFTYLLFDGSSLTLLTSGDVDDVDMVCGDFRTGRGM